VAEGELGKGEVAFAAETTLAETDKILGCVVLRAINDAEVFAAAARTITASGALSDALARLERSSGIHGGLKRGFNAIYGYTSDQKASVTRY
jgi:hypothetical protein